MALRLGAYTACLHDRPLPQALDVLQAHGLTSVTPMGGAARPHEVADVISLLAGPDARLVTGVVLPVDGGLRAGSGQPPHR